MIVYNNARFNPIDIQSQLIDIFSITSQNGCICHCYTNSSCITSTFIGLNQTCILFNASLQQGEIRIMIDSNASVMSFPNRSIDINVTKPLEMIEWLFDGDFNDVYGEYNGELIDNNTAIWISPGYAGYGNAVYFPFNNYSLVDHYLNLIGTNFTISAWIWNPNPISIFNYEIFLLFDHCESMIQDKCLQIAIENGKLYLSFYNDDLLGNTQIYSNQWYHVAYVYDQFNSKQFVYLNGILDGSRTVQGSYIGNASQIILGSSLQFNSTYSFQNGYIDKLSFVSRIKNESELLDEATLVAYYSFDKTYLDSGPNQINNISNVNTYFDSYGHLQQSLVISSSFYSTYFQTTGFYYLGQTNYSYSFSIWIYPFSNTGTILQISSPNGSCIPMIGFNRIGQLTIQTLSINGIYATSLTSYSLINNNNWNHICMTYSVMNGIQLFVNGSLMNFNNTFTDYMGSNEFVTITIGTNPQSSLCLIDRTQIVPSQFQGMIDEFKIFSRQLSPNEIYQLSLI